MIVVSLLILRSDCYVETILIYVALIRRNSTRCGKLGNSHSFTDRGGTRVTDAGFFFLFATQQFAPVWSVPAWRHILQLKSVQITDFNFPPSHGKARQVRLVT